MREFASITDCIRMSGNMQAIGSQAYHPVLHIGDRVTHHACSDQTPNCGQFPCQKPSCIQIKYRIRSLDYERERYKPLAILVQICDKTMHQKLMPKRI